MVFDNFADRQRILWPPKTNNLLLTFNILRNVLFLNIIWFDLPSSKNNLNFHIQVDTDYKYFRTSNCKSLGRKRDTVHRIFTFKRVFFLFYPWEHLHRYLQILLGFDWIRSIKLTKKGSNFRSKHSLLIHNLTHTL